MDNYEDSMVTQNYLAISTYSYPLCKAVIMIAQSRTNTATESFYVCLYNFSSPLNFNLIDEQ